MELNEPSSHTHCYHNTDRADGGWCCICVPAMDWPLPVARVMEENIRMKDAADELADRLTSGGPRTRMRNNRDER